MAYTLLVQEMKNMRYFLSIVATIGLINHKVAAGEDAVTHTVQALAGLGLAK